MRKIVMENKNRLKLEKKDGLKKGKTVWAVMIGRRESRKEGRKQDIAEERKNGKEERREWLT